MTLVHKGNIMKFTEGAFKTWGYELAAEEFAAETITESDVWDEHDGKVPEGKIVIKDRIADAMFQQILLRPDEYDVIATTNLNGDYLSDALAAQVGGLGMAPGSNEGDGMALFEATHGTAPKYADQDKVNPGSLILSGVMMLQWLGWREAADDARERDRRDDHPEAGDLRPGAPDGRRHQARDLRVRRRHRREPVRKERGSTMDHKVTVVGAGHVGATTAQRIAEAELADVVMIDIMADMAQGKALDMMESAPVLGFDAKIEGGSDYDLTAGSDVCVVTAGLPRKPGMSRDDLLAKNQAITQEVVDELIKRSPDTILIIVTNPLDAMCEVARRVSGSRASACSAWPACSTPPACATSWRPSWASRSRTSTPSCSAATATPWCRWPATRPSPASRCRSSSTTSGSRRSTSAPARAAARSSACSRPARPTTRRRLRRSTWSSSILRDKKQILPCAVYLQGEYGLEGVYAGVPAKLGRKGIEKVDGVRARRRRARGAPHVRRGRQGAVREAVGRISPAVGAVNRVGDRTGHRARPGPRPAR